MPIDIQRIELNGPTPSTFTDRIRMAAFNAIATAAGGGAGAAVTTAFVFAETGMFGSTYNVHATCNLAVTTHVTAKTAAGFNVVITPVLATTTLAAGLLDVTVVG